MRYTTYMKRTITLVIGLVVSGAIMSFIFINALLQGDAKNFQECKDRGYPIQESYPEVCSTPEGKRFTNTDQKANL